MRKIKFENGQFYHIYCRGLDLRDIFNDDKEFIRFTRNLIECNNTLSNKQREYIKRRISENYDLDLLYRELSPNPSPLFAASEPSPPYVELGSDVFISELGLDDKYILFLLRFPPLVDIITYCLNPNHYHIQLKQLVEGGISKFLQKINLAYTNYFNCKNSRVGRLFESVFKAKHIDSDEYLLSVSAYINANAEIHGITNDAENYRWCSYPEYLGKTDFKICNSKIILDHFKSVEDYRLFVKEQIKISKNKKSNDCF